VYENFIVKAIDSINLDFQINKPVIDDNFKEIQME